MSTSYVLDRRTAFNGPGNRTTVDMIVRMAERPLEQRMVERLQRWYHRDDPPPQKPPERITYGRLSYANRAPHVIVHPGDPEAKIQVGNYTSIAADVEFIVGGNHRTDWVSSFPFRHILDMPGRGYLFESGCRLWRATEPWPGRTDHQPPCGSRERAGQELSGSRTNPNVVVLTLS